MRTFSKLFIIFSALVMIAATNQTNDCRQKLKDYSRKVSFKELPSGKQVYYIHYEVMTQMRSGSGGESKTEIKSLVSNTGMYYESNTISMYKDAEEIYTVIHPQKVIVKSKTDKKINADLRKQQASLLQDTLIDNSIVKPCRMGTYNGKNLTMIELVPNAGAVKKLFIEKIIYYLDEEKQVLHGQEIFYSSASPVRKREIKFHSLDFNHNGKVKAKAREYIFDGEKFKAQFKGYTFEDNSKE